MTVAAKKDIMITATMIAVTKTTTVMMIAVKMKKVKIPVRMIVAVTRMRNKSTI
ncbi:hypothetical protein GCM10007968_01890 [Sporolactobacillus putidus]|uniref:Uncharacterized protein n=1 Tax=Sporolactobacillus putidus TaxID=492735 RepID=A0A917RWA0_9BACL|nr:hypothetical protein GCM10007968_01890 [Sporolactobacillus putidus]